MLDAINLEDCLKFGMKQQEGSAGGEEKTRAPFRVPLNTISLNKIHVLPKRSANKRTSSSLAVNLFGVPRWQTVSAGDVNPTNYCQHYFIGTLSPALHMQVHDIQQGCWASGISNLQGVISEDEL